MSAVTEYYVASRPEFVSFLQPEGPFPSAIDIGCAGGMLGSTLMQQGIVKTCDGIEPFPAAAELAGKSLRQVWHGALENVAEAVPWQDYALVMMADVLEHLVDPWSTLRFLRERTAPGCRLALSVPNVRHYKVVLPLLLRDEFTYRDHGIMDRTHLHFFTAGSIRDTLHECGWKIVRRGSHMKKSYRRWYMPTRLLEPFVTVQYLMIAEKR
ncbi:MAG: class I SAM-dependent methyltransferase [Rhodocyclaceae bacterium]|nr:class I SAM-dependent methyltransferase [Rhodocyclaceae bacterium]